MATLGRAVCDGRHLLGQILDHVVPGTGSYGNAVFGLLNSTPHLEDPESLAPVLRSMALAALSA